MVVGFARTYANKGPIEGKLFFPALVNLGKSSGINYLYFPVYFWNKN
jgi:hypothetical protein